MSNVFFIIFMLMVSGALCLYAVQKIKDEEYSSGFFYLFSVLMFIVLSTWEIYQWRSETTQSHITDAEIISKVPQNILNAPGKNVTPALCDITIENGKVIEAGCDVNFAC